MALLILLWSVRFRKLSFWMNVRLEKMMHLNACVKRRCNQFKDLTVQRRFKTSNGISSETSLPLVQRWCFMQLLNKNSGCNSNDVNPLLARSLIFVRDRSSFSIKKKNSNLIPIFKIGYAVTMERHKWRICYTSDLKNHNLLCITVIFLHKNDSMVFLTILRKGLTILIYIFPLMILNSVRMKYDNHNIIIIIVIYISITL